MAEQVRRHHELYRRISARMWADEDFRKLSGPEPNARDLWIYLLTGLHTRPIPGLFAAHQEELARKLGWPLVGFRRVLAELMPQGFAEGYQEGLFEGLREASGEPLRKQFLEADWDAGVVWIENAYAHNPPQSPKVVIGWAKHWPLIPECVLKDTASRRLRELCHDHGKAFGKAFDDAIWKPFAKPSRKPTGISGTGSGTGSGVSKPRATRGENGAAEAHAEHTGEAASQALVGIGGALAFEVQEGWREAYFEAQAGAPPRLVRDALAAAVAFTADVAKLHGKTPREAARTIAAETLRSDEKGVRVWGLTKLDPYAAAPRDVRRGVARPSPVTAFKATKLDDLFGPKATE